MADKKADSGTSEDTQLTLVKSQFVDFEDNTVAYRSEAELMRAYKDGKQWTDKEIKAIEARGQPVITDNKIVDKIETMLGIEKERRTDPKALPRNNPADEKAAEAATDGMRYVADDNMWDFTKSEIAENLFVEGVGGVEITTDNKLPKNSKVPKVRLDHIRWDRQYWDPHSFDCDFGDGMFKGIVTWMDIGVALAKWPDSKTIIEASVELGAAHMNSTRSGSNTSDTFEDKPRWAINTSGRKRIQAFDHHFIKDGVWNRCIFVAAGFIKEPEPSPYLDDEGEPQSSIEYQALYRQGSDGMPYGAIRRYHDLQDDWNKRRSKSTHLLNTNQVIMEDGAAGSDPKAVEKIRKEAARPDGVLVAVPGMKMDFNKNVDLAQGHLALMQLTGQALDSTGPNAALAGQTGSISGRAKQIDAQGGLIAIDKPFDQLRYLTLRTYRHIWNRITQYWKAETWIRIRDEEHLKFIPLNRTITIAEMMAERLGQERDISDEDKQKLLENIALNPEYRKTFKQNDVSQLDVDIIIDEAADVVTLQHEEFAVIAEVARTRPELPFSVIIEASSLRSDTKRKIKEAMQPTDDPAAALAQQIAQAVAQLEPLIKEAEVRALAAKAAKDEAEAADTAMDTVIKTAEFTGGEASTAPTSVN